MPRTSPCKSLIGLSWLLHAGVAELADAQELKDGFDDCGLIVILGFPERFSFLNSQ
jgi:hypothetical protein